MSTLWIHTLFFRHRSKSQQFFVVVIFLIFHIPRDRRSVCCVFICVRFSDINPIFLIHCEMISKTKSTNYNRTNLFHLPGVFVFFAFIRLQSWQSVCLCFCLCLCIRTQFSLESKLFNKLWFFEERPLTLSRVWPSLTLKPFHNSVLFLHFC